MMKKLLIMLVFLLGNQIMNAQTALDFNQSDGVVFLNNVIPLPASYTLEARFKSPLPSNVNSTLFCGSSFNLPLLVHNNVLGAWDSSGGTKFNSTGFDMTTLSVGWHHIAVVCSGTNTIFYVDGVNVGSVAFQSSGNIYAIGNNQVRGQNFGTVDEVAIWNVTKSSTAIQNSLTSCLTGSETDLIAFYDFEDGSGSTLTDVSGVVTGNGTSFNGTLTNMDTVNDWISGFDCATLGVDDLFKNDMIQVYPNPTSDVLTINQIEIGSKIQLMSITGQVIYSAKSTKESHTINTSMYSKGVYILKVSDDKASLSGKIIID